MDQIGGAASALARKAARGRAERPQPLAMTPARALALALSRAADTDLSLPLRAHGVTPRALSLADLPEAIMDQALIAVLEGPGEALGIAALCPITVASLIEVQTMGRLSHRPVTPRRPTRTDAALAAPFLDVVMAGFEDLLTGIAGQEWAAGYRFASFLDDPRPLGLMLEDGALRGLSADLTMGGDGQRQGRLLLALPAQARLTRAEPARGTVLHPATLAAQAAAARAAAQWQDDLQGRVMQAEVAITGVLARIALPLTQAMDLQPGALLPLPDGAAQDLRLEVAGQVIATARLGQHRGQRALRLNGPGAAMSSEVATAPGGEGILAVPPAGLTTQPLGELPALDDLPSLAALPALGELPTLGDLPPLGELPPLPMAGFDNSTPEEEMALVPLKMAFG
ncbi:FliM/FliN family flagellar motor switch protein [Paracoccus sp. p3-h83]|uniref:FliM/FliN family flagellar motor switch protein n=1 Tax=Paracoccus sp. p3-h83 TaxID=3342805 RepID=UPI0035B7B7F5